LLRPSPDTSITRRAPRYGALGNRVIAWSMAPLIDVPPPNSWRDSASIAAASASMDASSLTSIQGTTCTCSTGPVHCTMVTAIACREPERTARSRSGLRKAAT